MRLFKRDCEIYGHKFEPRYDIGKPDLSMFSNFKGYGLKEIIESLKPKTYVKDVCIDCGMGVGMDDDIKTLRDEIAIAAMAALIDSFGKPCGSITAQNAYAYADAMIKERNKNA